MTIESLLIILIMMTFIAALVFAQVSKVKTEERMKDPNARKSSLAADGNPKRAAD